MTELTREQLEYNREEMRQYFMDQGFEHHCYISGDGHLECLSDLEGMYVTINATNRTFELSVIDGVITCKTGSLSFPNKNLPVFIKKLQRHIFD